MATISLSNEHKVFYVLCFGQVTAYKVIFIGVKVL